MKTREERWRALVAGTDPQELLARVVFEGVCEIRKLRRHLDGTVPPRQDGPSVLGALDALVKNTTAVGEVLGEIEVALRDIDSDLDRATMRKDT